MSALRPLLSRAYHSATLNTWASFGARALSLLVVLPLVLRSLTAAEVAVWYLLSSIIALQVLADMGIGVTSMRAIAYAIAGAERIGDFRRSDGAVNREPNWPLVRDVVTTMRSLYVALSAIAMMVLGIVGTLALTKPMRLLDDPVRGWAAWLVVLTVSAIGFFGSIYSTYLHGHNRVALVRRWEAISLMGSVLTSLFVLLVGGRILALAIASQAWVLLNMLRNRWLCYRLPELRFDTCRGWAIERPILLAIWPNSWRAGLGVAIGTAVAHASGIIYAQLGNVQNVASYLLSLRVAQTVGLFSQAPFYSKIPMLSQMRSQGRDSEHVALASRGMRLSYWAYAIPFVIVGVTAGPFLDMADSNVSFAGTGLWALFGIAGFAERYGAMHLQLAATANHVVWHIANGMTGIVFLLVSWAAYPTMGVYAFPLGMVAGNLGVYAWYSARQVYRPLNIEFWPFQRSTAIAPLALVVVYCLGAIIAG